MGVLAVTMLDRTFWNQKRVFVTGHTGFKGGWLVTWLLKMGALVTGYALEPGTVPSYFTLCELAQRMRSIIGDVRDMSSLAEAIQRQETEIVFHLAAQPLVRRSYRDPSETISTNVMGTTNVLEVVRHAPSVRAIVIVTSDKCYENRGQPWRHREDDRIGGYDPYSASKACAELIAAAYQRSFFAKHRHVATATVRAGNVIGGGDWAEDRIVPDTITALQRAEPVIVRSPQSVRPWQHVLEPLSGYMMLAERLFKEGSQWGGPWNFGPGEDFMTVAGLTALIIRTWGKGQWKVCSVTQDRVHESHDLRLDSSKAQNLLGWAPRLTLEEAVQMTVSWYREAEKNQDMWKHAFGQIEIYERKAGSVTAISGGDRYAASLPGV